MIKVFVSSVSRGLEDIRGQIVDDLHTGRYGVVNMEAFGARPEVPLEVCLRELRTADVAVVIIGPRYGSLVPAGDVSYTHKEFREAIGHGIPVLAFKLPLIDDLDADERQRLERFAAEAAASLTYQEATTHRLSALIQASLTGARDRGELGPRFRLFQPWDRFFSAQLSGDPTDALFNHLSPFIGRTEELQRLIDFANEDQPVFVLMAPGGTGKSRLLLEAAKELDSDAPNAPRALFVDAGAEWTAQDIVELPSGPTLLVVDDAHRRPDLDRLISACRQQNPHIRFVVSCRPAAIDIVRPHLAELTTEETADNELTLAPLSHADAISLASTCLGSEFEHLGERLVRVADQNPLVICVGARCIGLKQVAPEILDHTPEEFRRVVLDSLIRDPSFSGHDAESRRRLLELLAAAGPVNAEDAALAERMAAFIGVPVHELNAMLAALQVAGFIQRRGRLVRITPDVLADHLLYRAAVGATGTPTGFVDAAISAFAPDLLSNILANAAELDWRAIATATHEPVLTTTWNALLDELPQATHRQRAGLLGQLRRATVFAPADVLRIVEWICDHRDAPKDEQLVEYGLGDKPDKALDAASDLLAFIATHPDFTIRCLTRLWQFAVVDERPTNPNPGHPRRRIHDLMAYDGRTPDAVQQQTLDFVSTQLTAGGERPDAPWAVNALGAVLERQGQTTTSTKRQFTLGAFPLAQYLDQLRDRRQNAMDCLLAIAHGSRSAEAVAAIHEFGELLRKPLGMFGRDVSDDEVATWLPEAEQAAKLLQKIATTAPTDLIRFLARRQLRETSREHWPELAATLDSATEGSPPVDGEKLFDILVGMPWGEELDDWKAEQDRVRKACEEAAERFWRRYGTPEDTVSALLEAIAAIGQTTRTDPQNEWMLVRSLVSARADDAAVVVKAFASSDTETGLRLIQPVLAAMLESGRREEALALVREYAEADNDLLRAHIADALRYFTGRTDEATPEDTELPALFIQDSSTMVRRCAVRSLGNLGKVAPQDALSLLVSVEWDQDLQLAESVCSVFHPRHGLDPGQLSDDQIDVILGRIAQLQSLEGRSHNILEFVAFASERRPRQTVDMLLSRVAAVDRETDRGDERWTPIPYNAQGLSLAGLKAAPDYLDLLRLIRDASVGASPLANFWFPELYSAAATDVGTALSALREWVQSGDSEKIVAAAHLLRGFDHSIVFSEHEFVAELLDAAAAASTDCLDHCRSELFGVAISGVYSGSPGQPAPRHVSDKENAQELVAHYADRPPAKQFYKGLVRHAEDSIKRQLQEWDEEDDAA